LDIIVFQTADAFRYARMLAVTAPTAIEYCRRHGFRYESFVGIKRGAWPLAGLLQPHHPLQELLDRGFAGWAFYLDADAGSTIWISTCPPISPTRATGRRSSRPPASPASMGRQ
jgi:hypothetical protein